MVPLALTEVMISPRFPGNLGGTYQSIYISNYLHPIQAVVIQPTEH